MWIMESLCRTMLRALVAGLEVRGTQSVFKSCIWRIDSTCPLWQRGFLPSDVPTRMSISCCLCERTSCIAISFQSPRGPPCRVSTRVQRTIDGIENLFLFLMWWWSLSIEVTTICVLIMTHHKVPLKSSLDEVLFCTRSRVSI